MGVLIDGIYYKDDAFASKTDISPVAMQGQMNELERQAQKFDRELVQPYTNDGKLNPEFEKHYPDVVEEWKKEGVKLNDEPQL